VKKGRRLAFDFGDVRIGVAICDPDAIISSPLPRLMRKNPALFKEIADLIDEYRPVGIYCGMPKHLSGMEGQSAEKVREFVNDLSRFDLPVTLVDERLSTVSASQKLREAGHTSRESKELIDSMAAVAILEQGLALEK
jgi:putative Holliday junction resolvase